MKKLILLFLLLQPCWVVVQSQDAVKAAQPKVEVYYFHATMRCPTCLAVEEQTKKTLDENFAEELNSGAVILHVLNLEEKENKALTEKFEIGWSSLILHDPASDKSVNLTEDAFANARTHPEEFRTELDKKIRELL